MEVPGYRRPVPKLLHLSVMQYYLADDGQGNHNTRNELLSDGIAL